MKLRVLLPIIALFAPSAAAAQTWSVRTIAGMSVHLYVPAAGPAHPGGRGLLIVLHGCTQQPGTFRDRGNFEPAAERYGMIVALPGVPNGGVIAGCWDYYGEAHTRTTRHSGPVLQLARELSEDAILGIDGDQLYLAGFSSGGGQAMVTGCLAPDVFAGVGINAGPVVGTESNEPGFVATDLASALALCRRWAGAEADHFATQLASIIHGDRDTVVAPGYAPLAAEMYAELFRAGGAPLVQAPLDVTALAGFEPRGTGSVWSDASGPRLSLIVAEAMSHAFPAGSGPGGETGFIASRGVSWPAHLARLFTENNRRVPAAPDAGVPPGDDAGIGGPADAASPADGGVPRADAGALGSGRNDRDDGGCRCAAGRRDVEALLLPLAACLLWRRRRAVP